jgi:hypothetical protein
MRKVIADEWMTLDGVIQAPGQADEDSTGGFQHGGWHLGYLDDIALQWVADGVVKAGGFLLEDDVAEAVAALKDQDGEDLHLIGSGELAQTLFAHDLVDELDTVDEWRLSLAATEATSSRGGRGGPPADRGRRPGRRTRR